MIGMNISMHIMTDNDDDTAMNISMHITTDNDDDSAMHQKQCMD